MGSVIDASRVRERLRERQLTFGFDVHEALLGAAALALAVAKGRAPGKIPGTLSSRLLNQYAVRISSSWRGATWIENGTKRHIIEPKNGSVLAFTVNGSMTFAKRVDHPGNRGVHFMRAGQATGQLELFRLCRDLFR